MGGVLGSALMPCTPACTIADTASHEGEDFAGVAFRVRWPDGTETLCNSPSLIIREYFTPGESYEFAEFVDRLRMALNIASERIFQKY